MKHTLVSKILKVLLICVFTIEIGITVGYVMLLNIDFNKYNENINININK